MKVLGCLGFYSCYTESLHEDSNCFHDLIRDFTSFHWTEEHENIFQMIKDGINEDTSLSVPSTDYPFHFHVISSSVGNGCILIQPFPEGKRIISVTSGILEEAEQKMFTLHGHCVGLSQLCKLLSTKSLDLVFQYIVL